MDNEKETLPVSSKLSTLCAMMDADESALMAWSAHDLAAILTHLLASPVDRELVMEGRAQPESGGIEGGSRTLWTFGKALVMRDVPRDLLMRIKEYAKRAMDVGDTLPRDVAKAIYVAVIAHARTCGYASVSSLPVASFERLCRWCLAQSWVPAVIRTAVREAVGSE